MIVTIGKEPNYMRRRIMAGVIATAVTVGVCVAGDDTHVAAERTSPAGGMAEPVLYGFDVPCYEDEAAIVVRVNEPGYEPDGLTWRCVNREELARMENER